MFAGASMAQLHDMLVVKIPRASLISVPLTVTLVRPWQRSRHSFEKYAAALKPVLLTELSLEKRINIDWPDE